MLHRTPQRLFDKSLLSFLWPIESLLWADLFLTWHTDYLLFLILTFIISLASWCIIMPFLAVWFLRVVLHWPQNLVSFKKIPCTDSQLKQQQAILQRKWFHVKNRNDLQTQKASFKTKYCTWRMFWGSYYWLQLQSLDQKAYPTSNLRQAENVSIFSLSLRTRKK